MAGFGVGVSYPPDDLSGERLARTRAVDGRMASSRSVLVVDDYADSREIYCLWLRADRWCVEQAANGVEALTLAASFEPNVIVMDLYMPVLDGVETTRRLKAYAPTAAIPVVACTAFGRLYERAVRDGTFAAFVVKPCSWGQLRAVLERVLGPRKES
jgi:CheY-like chemotaxis protein